MLLNCRLPSAMARFRLRRRWASVLKVSCSSLLEFTILSFGFRRLAPISGGAGHIPYTEEHEKKEFGQDIKV